MKKVVFVEKDDHSSYDPVAAYFGNKKPASLIKPPKAQPPKKIEESQPTQSKPTQQFVLMKSTPKIPSVKKVRPVIHRDTPEEQFQVPQKKSRAGERQKIVVKKKQAPPVKEKQKSLQKSRAKVSEQQMREDSLQKQKIKKGAESKASKKPNISQGLIADYEKKIVEYERRLTEFEEKEEKWHKGEQKMIKLQKEAKGASLKAKELSEMAEKLKHKQDQIKQLLRSSDIPYSRKREIILRNQMVQLKRVNEQLVMRIKNYRGSDLVEIATQGNHAQILGDIRYQQKSDPYRRQMDMEMEGLQSGLIRILDTYLKSRVSGKLLSWNQQHRYILELLNIAERISISYLENYDVLPLPKNNEECVLSSAKQYMQDSGLSVLVDKLSLNFAISEQNARILQQVESNREQRLQLRRRLKRGKKVNNEQLVRIYELRAGYGEVVLVQAICQLEVVRQLVKASNTRINGEMQGLGTILQQVQALVDLGGNLGKESLFLFMSENIAALRSRRTLVNLRASQLMSGLENIQKMAQESKS